MTVESGTLFDGVTIELGTIAAGQDWLECVTFLNCDIIGPATVIVGARTAFPGTIIEGASEEVFFNIAPGHKPGPGEIGVRDCNFASCRVRGVRFGAPPEVLRQMHG